MKITAQEEYGIRLLLRIGGNPSIEGLTISQLSRQEGLSPHYVAKLCRVLRIAGLIQSSRGKEGGYTLARPAEEIRLNQVLTILGGKLYSKEFCRNHSGLLKNCSHQSSCPVRSVWQLVQQAVDQVLDGFTLKDLLILESSNNGLQKDLSPLLSETSSAFSGK
ncbi:MAG: Rrf2 family transcriptional regulator [Calditrichaeota bacterium]|nr:Rrf2 family transcriptional regulator [Calditrichota bacterium]RQW01371.1 MAG: Rrf2 family transcriptional regulator [Calditrichota bacterium]